MAKFGVKPAVKVSRPLVRSKVPVHRKASVKATTTNLAGGLAFKMSDKAELVTTCAVGLLWTKRTGLRMYETEAARTQRIQGLVRLSGAEFAAKLALSLRIQHGQRSITHLLAAIIATEGRGQPWLASFFEQVCVRADDPLEILAAYWMLNPTQKGITPNAMRKGFAKAFNKWNKYRLAKYAGGNHSPTLKDLACLVHPKPVAANRVALSQLIKGQLKNEDTWEARLSGAKAAGKTHAKVWSELILEGKMGQLGLLRNLRNIKDAGVPAEIMKEACRQLTDKDAIRKNGILPAQYLTAYEVIGSQHGLLRDSIDEAVEISAGNVPSIGDRVLIAIDESGSMGQIERDNAALFAATLLKANPKADLMYFAGTARYAENIRRRQSLMDLTQAIKAGMRSGGTNFNTIFETARQGYDAIVILSDGEGWMGGRHGGAPIASQAAYEKMYGKPVIFSFDLAGDGALMFREDGIILLAGFSFQVFKLMKILMEDRTKLADVIDKIRIGQPLPSNEEAED